MKKWLVPVVASAFLMGACSEVDQLVDSGKQVLETGKKVVETGKQMAESEIAQHLQSYLQEKYDNSAALRNAMFSGDGQLMVAELQKTELAQFTFYESELFDVRFVGKLTADGTFRVLQYKWSDPGAQPKVLHEYNVILGTNGQILLQ